MNELTKFLVHLKVRGLGIVMRRVPDWVAAANAWLATYKLNIDPEAAGQIVTLTGNLVGDLLVSLVLFLVSRFLSFRKLEQDVEQVKTESLLGKSVPMILLFCCLMPLLLTSCADFRVGGFVRDEKSGAKMVLREGEKPSFQLPIRDDEGRFSGFVTISGK